MALSRALRRHMQHVQKDKKDRENKVKKAVIKAILLSLYFIWKENKTKWIWIYDREKKTIQVQSNPHFAMKDHKKGIQDHKKAV